MRNGWLEINSMDDDEAEGVFREYDIPDDAITINRLFTEYEQTIAELRRQLREQQTRPPRYTHRNGETAPPDIAGWYWTTTPVRREFHPIFCYGKDIDPHYESIYGWGRMTYYGPIPQPITKETNP